MTQDIAGLIGAVTREVTGREHNGRPARVICASRTYDTTMEDVWDAVTNAERIPRWFLPVSGDLRLGGRYQLQGNASGEITGCNPPRHLALMGIRRRGELPQSGSLGVSRRWHPSGARARGACR